MSSSREGAEMRGGAGEHVVQVESAGGNEAIQATLLDSGANINVAWINESIEQEMQPFLDRKQPHPNSSTIHRVHSNLRDGNEGIYTPQLVSIGPYHYREEKLKAGQAIKMKFVAEIMERTKLTSDENPLPRCIASVSKKASEAKQQYSGAVNLELEEFVKMMVVDGCFIIEFLLKHYCEEWKHHEDTVQKRMSTLKTDLVLVENQIPFFILRDLFQVFITIFHKRESKCFDPCITIELLAFYLFTAKKGITEEGKAKSYRHLLHFYHTSLHPDIHKTPSPRFIRIRNMSRKLILRSNSCSLFGLFFLTISCLVWVIFKMFKVCWGYVQKIVGFLLTCSRFRFPLFIRDVAISVFGLSSADDEDEDEELTYWIPSAIFLRNTGFTLYCKYKSAVLDIYCKGRTIKIPHIFFVEETLIIYKNLIAFEHSSPEDYGHRFTAFAAFMGYLVTTEEDVAFLIRRGIIVNRLGKDEEIVKFFNNIRKDIFIDIKEVCLDEHIKKYLTEDYYKAFFFQLRKKLVPEYFSNPWSIPSMIAAFILLVLTALQTFYTVYPNYHADS